MKQEITNQHIKEAIDHVFKEQPKPERRVKFKVFFNDAKKLRNGMIIF